MLDDFVDVTKDEKKLMHLWNSFVRKQRYCNLCITLGVYQILLLPFVFFPVVTYVRIFFFLISTYVRILSAVMTLRELHGT